MSALNDLANSIEASMDESPGFIAWTGQGPMDLAVALTAAGYSKPRTITDVKDLATVYAGAIIRDAEGQLWGIDGSTDNLFAVLDGVGEPYSDHDVIMPAVVIYEGK